jgi:hypothetical protein
VVIALTEAGVGVWYSAGPSPPVLAMNEILPCLKKHGQRLDSELAKETGVPIAMVRVRLAELAASGAIITCNLTRFEQGKRTDGLLCRMSGWFPPPAPGRKAKLPA